MSHHWLVRPRGGERVLEALAELVPNAPIYTLVHDRAGMAGSSLAHRVVRTSLLQYLPGSSRSYPRWLPFLPWVARRMRLPPVDLVVCSDAAVAKAMRADERSTVVCYCYSPMRYAWEERIGREYRSSLPGFLRPFWAPTMALARRADARAARRVNLFVAISHHVAERIRRCYGRRAVVVYPPVDVPPSPVLRPREDFYLCVGYHTPYKRLDLAVEACRLAGKRLIVIGEGPDIARIDRRRDDHVELLGWQPDAVVHDHLCRALGLLFPGEEDFGIVPVEAFARGCPVVAYGVGGATETVAPDVCGVWFESQTASAVREAIRSLEERTFDPVAMHDHALGFSKPRFLREMREVLLAAIDGTLGE